MCASVTVTIITSAAAVTVTVTVHVAVTVIVTVTVAVTVMVTVTSIIAAEVAVTVVIALATVTVITVMATVAVSAKDLTRILSNSKPEQSSGLFRAFRRIRVPIPRSWRLLHALLIVAPAEDITKQPSHTHLNDEQERVISESHSHDEGFSLLLTWSSRRS